MRTLAVFILLVSGIAQAEGLIYDMSGNIGLQTGSYVHYSNGMITQQLGSAVFETAPPQVPVYQPQAQEIYQPVEVEPMIRTFEYE